MSAWFNKKFLAVMAAASIAGAANAQSNGTILPTLPGWEDTEVVAGARQESQQSARQGQQVNRQGQGQKEVVLVLCKDANGELVYRMKEVDSSSLTPVQNVEQSRRTRNDGSRYASSQNEGYTDIYNYDGGRGHGVSVTHGDGSRTTVERSNGKTSVTRNPRQGGYVKVGSDGHYSYDVGVSNSDQKVGVVTTSRNNSGNTVTGVNTGNGGRVTVLTGNGGVTIRSYNPETGTSEVSVGKNGVRSSGRTRIKGDIVGGLINLLGGRGH